MLEIVLKEHSKGGIMFLTTQKDMREGYWQVNGSFSTVGDQTLLQPHRSLLLSGVVFMFYI